MKKEQMLYAQWVEKATEEPDFAAELAAIRDDPAEMQDRFYQNLIFGTAGLRGVLGLGTNRMNLYTVRQATQGLANWLWKTCENPSAAIAYDSRLQSDRFARETARVLAANGVKVYLYAELMPTPALSYAVRELKCDTGVVITASHNPAQYNGYKAYGRDGSQLGPEAAEHVMQEIAATDPFTGVRLCDFDQALAEGQIVYLPESFIQQYIDRVLAESFYPEHCAKAGLKVVFTPLNGAGSRCVCTALAKAGVTDITIVPEQAHPDGHFPTCPYPNPETKEALEKGLALCEKVGADILLATDPDADRAAIAVRHNGAYVILTGNEVGVLLLDYICKCRKQLGTMPAHPIAVRSIVSSRLADAVAHSYGVEMVQVLTGFRFIGAVIAKLEQTQEGERFIFGFEESCGYLSGGYVRDKDAINASLLLAEMASASKLYGRTLVDVLNDIYHTHGIYQNIVDSFSFAGADGMVKMQSIMEGLRSYPPVEIGGEPIVSSIDYQTSVQTKNGVQTTLDLPPSNVLEYGLQNGCSILIRPSGTEPKIKIYYCLVASSRQQVETILTQYRKSCGKIVE